MFLKIYSNGSGAVKQLPQRLYAEVLSFDVAWNNCFRKVFNACWRESVKPLLFYCNTLPASLLIEQRKMIFYNKTLHSNNIVLRTVCALHRNEGQKLSSMYHIFLGHSNNIDIKRAVWSCFARLLKI